MNCQHCGEELEPRWGDDPAARCPHCEQCLAEAPVDFQPVVKTEVQDIEAVQRVLETLQQRSPELFVLPQMTIPFPTLPPTHKQIEPATTTHQPTPLQTLLLQPAPAMPPETVGPSLNWLFLGIGSLCFACGGVLVILATALARADLWSIGFPLILGGQGGIIFGLVGLVESHQQRATKFREALREHREHLEILQQIAVLQQNSANSTPTAELPINQLRMQWEILRQMRSSKAA